MTIESPRIAAIGVASWDELRILDRYPIEGSWATVLESQFATGGTTGNLVAAAARLGARVTFFSKMGGDETGRAIIDDLTEHGVDCSHCTLVAGPADLSIVLVSRETGERTILWQQGPHLQRGDQIDVDLLFTADMTVIDLPDLPLRRFLTDLPAHTYPKARLLGTLSYLAGAADRDKVEIALRHDVLVGNEREYQTLTGVDSPDEALRMIQSGMTGSNLRTAIMTRAAAGATGVTRTEWIDCAPGRVVAVDTTGAGDAFAGAVAYAQALRRDLNWTLRFANSVASHVVSGIGAQRHQPSLDRALAGMAKTETWIRDRLG
jgi:ribokinase